MTREWYWASFGNAIGRPGMAAADLDGNGSVEVVVAAGQNWYVLEPHGSGYVQRWVNLPFNGEESDRLVVAQVDGATILPEWISEDLGSDVGLGDSLLAGDVDADGDPEIWVNAGSIGHFIFGVVSPSGVIFSGGFEIGTDSAWSALVQ